MMRIPGFPAAAALAALGLLGACVMSAPPQAGTVDVAATADAGPVSRGQALAQARCAACHATGAQDASAMAEAPPFRSLRQRYPVDYLQEALAEGLTTAHPAMPQVELTPDEIAALIAYLHSLET